MDRLSIFSVFTCRSKSAAMIHTDTLNTTVVMIKPGARLYV